MSCWGPSTGVRSGKEPRTATATTARRCSKFEKVVFGPNEAVCFNSWWRSCRRHEGFKCNFLWKISGESLLPGKMLQWGYLYEKSPDFIFVPVGVRDRTVEFVNFRQLWELQRSIWVFILQLFCGSQIPLTLSNCPISFPAQLMASTRLLTASVQWYSWLKVIFLVMRHKCIKSKEVAKKTWKIWTSETATLPYCMACWNCCCVRVEVDGGGGNAPNYMVAEIVNLDMVDLVDKR